MLTQSSSHAELWNATEIIQKRGGRTLFVTFSVDLSHYQTVYGKQFSFIITSINLKALKEAM
jgi:hypothetical protein